MAETTETGICKMINERRKLRFDDWEDVIADTEMLKTRGYDHASYGTLTRSDHIALGDRDEWSGGRLPQTIPMADAGDDTFSVPQEDVTPRAEQREGKDAPVTCATRTLRG